MGVSQTAQSPGDLKRQELGFQRDSRFPAVLINICASEATFLDVQLKGTAVVPTSQPQPKWGHSPGFFPKARRAALLMTLVCWLFALAAPV